MPNIPIIYWLFVWFVLLCPLDRVFEFNSHKVEFDGGFCFSCVCIIHKQVG